MLFAPLVKFIIIIIIIIIIVIIILLVQRNTYIKQINKTDE